MNQNWVPFEEKSNIFIPLEQAKRVSGKVRIVTMVNLVSGMSSVRLSPQTPPLVLKPES